MRTIVGFREILAGLHHRLIVSLAANRQNVRRLSDEVPDPGTEPRTSAHGRLMGGP